MGSLPNRFDSHHDVHFIISEALKRQVPQSLGDVTVQLAALHVELGENSVKAMRFFLRLYGIDRRHGLTVRRHLKAVERLVHSTVQYNVSSNKQTSMYLEEDDGSLTEVPAHKCSDHRFSPALVIFSDFHELLNQTGSNGVRSSYRLRYKRRDF